MSLFPEKNRRRPNAGLMMSQRRRRWTSINPTLGHRLVTGCIYFTSLKTDPTIKGFRTKISMKLV